jgi:hypothetical protein
MLEGEAHHLLGGITMLGQGAEPAGKLRPNGVSLFEGEQLQNAQGQGMEIDKALKGFDLAGDRLPKPLGGVRPVQIRGLAWGRGQRFEPKAIGKAPQQMAQRAATHLNLKPPTIGFNHRLGGEGEIAGD